MPNQMDRASSFVASRLRAHLSRPIEYRRGNDSVELPATVGRTVFETDGEAGYLRMESRDYIVTATDLCLSGGFIVPRRGDTIVEWQDGVAHAHEVVAPAGVPEWRWADADRKTIRIHAKATGPR